MLFSRFIVVTIVLSFGSFIQCLQMDKDELIAEESKQNFSPIRIYQSSPSSSSSSSSSSSNNHIVDIMKKSASDYWPQSEAPMMQDYHHQYNNNHNNHHSSYLKPLTNSIQNADYLMTSVNQAYLKGRDINVEPDHKPITLHYRTHAQPIVVHQTRLPGPKPEVKHTKSHEEPQRVVHEVIRPIIQEVHEIIQPYRRVVQQVQPVIEEVRTIIAKDAGNGNKATDSLEHMNGHNNMGGGGGGGHSAYSAASSHQQIIAHKPTNQQHFHQSISATSEVLRHLSPKTLQSYRKAMYEQNKDDDHVLPMATTNNQQINNNRFIRSRVYLTPKGIPVYQSNYKPPVYLSA